MHLIHLLSLSVTLDVDAHVLDAVHLLDIDHAILERLCYLLVLQRSSVVTETAVVAVVERMDLGEMLVGSDALGYGLRLTKVLLYVGVVLGSIVDTR